MPARAERLVDQIVHAQKYQKQQGIPTDFLTRSSKFGTHDPEGSALPIDRQQHFRVARFCSTTVDPETSSVDRFSLTPIDRQHKTSVDRYPSPDIDRHSISDIDRYLTARHGDAIRRQEASTRGVGDDVMKHHVNAIIEDDFWQVVKEEEMQEGHLEVESLMSFSGSHWCQSTPTTEHRLTYINQARSTGVPEYRSTGVPEYRSTTPTESTASCNAVKILTHEEFAAKHPHLPSPNNVRIDRHANSNVDRYSEANIDRQPSPPIDRRAPITYRVQMPKIDVARLNALRPKPKPSEQPPEPVRTPSDAGDDPMEEDRVSTRRTLRRRKEKVAKHLKRGANEKEKENFQKRVFRIPLHTYCG
ncbi:hypothetical protein F2Q69_00042209 [Brassica cretica]|uniref:Uncharacterized protein n=1 Tax=Brassica cretica TaxID=69181 RepID=A0A8S9N905_BRACR|nr:hypothetical protein F2Q69_00042209 [Brassica cretica]